MLVEMERTDGVAQPVLIPGNPVRMTDLAVGPEIRPPGRASIPTRSCATSWASANERAAALRADGVLWRRSAPLEVVARTVRRTSLTRRGPLPGPRR